tara:strand:+ start:2173 stop:2448 length:276 start_codon:yes stop_codon:yes gene_type:complete
MKYKIDVFKIFEEEHRTAPFYDKSQERLERRFNLFLKLMADPVRREVIKGKSKNVRKIARAYLELLIQMKQLGFQWMNEMNNNYLTNKKTI